MCPYPSKRELVRLGLTDVSEIYESEAVKALFNLAVVQTLHGKNNAAVKNLKIILRANANNKKAKLLLSKIKKEIGQT